MLWRRDSTSDSNVAKPRDVQRLLVVLSPYALLSLDGMAPQNYHKEEVALDEFIDSVVQSVREQEGFVQEPRSSERAGPRAEWVAPHRELIRAGSAPQKQRQQAFSNTLVSPDRDAPWYTGFGFELERVSAAAREAFGGAVRAARDARGGSVVATMESTAELTLKYLKEDYTCMFVDFVDYEDDEWIADVWMTHRLSVEDWRAIERAGRVRARAACRGDSLVVRVPGHHLRRSETESVSRNFPYVWQRSALSSGASKTWPVLAFHPRQGYVSIVTSSDADYVRGAIVLGRSIAFQDASRPRIAMLVEDDVSEEFAEIESLLTTQGGWSVVRVQPLKEQWFYSKPGEEFEEEDGERRPNRKRGMGSSKCPHKPARKSQWVRWGRMATKLRAFELDFDLLLYLDLDVLVTGPIQEAFRVAEAHPEYSILSEAGTAHRYVNAGVFFLRPSKELFNVFMDRFETGEPPGIFPNLVDCTEMGLMNAVCGKPDPLTVEKGRVIKSPGLSGSSDDRKWKSATMPKPGSTHLTFGRPDEWHKQHAEVMTWTVHFLREDLCPKPWNTCREDGTAEELMKSPGDDFQCASKPYEKWCRLNKLEF